jgi:hypothetical protein
MEDKIAKSSLASSPSLLPSLSDSVNPFLSHLLHPTFHNYVTNYNDNAAHHQSVLRAIDSLPPKKIKANLLAQGLVYFRFDESVLEIGPCVGLYGRISTGARHGGELKN